MKNCILALSVILSAASANASVICQILGPGKDPGSYDKVMLEVTVPPSPSTDPSDKRRFRMVVVKKDNSSAYEINHDDFMKMVNSGDFKAIDGDAVVSLQETAEKKHVYASVITGIDASVKLGQMRYDAFAGGALPFGQIDTARDFSVSCEEK